MITQVHVLGQLTKSRVFKDFLLHIRNPENISSKEKIGYKSLKHRGCPLTYTGILRILRIP